MQFNWILSKHTKIPVEAFKICDSFLQFIQRHVFIKLIFSEQINIKIDKPLLS